MGVGGVIWKLERQDTQATMESSKQTSGGWWHERMMGYGYAATPAMGQSGADEDDETMNQEKATNLSVNFLTTTEPPRSRQKVTDKKY